MIEPARAAPFWQSRLLWVALALGSLLPFLVTTIVPFNDLPNHVGRHHVFLTLAQDPFLQRFYAVQWSLIGNLGIDLIVRAIGPWLGADLATHMAVAIIPPLIIAGIYSLSRAVNGEVTPAALAATPLCLNWPLITGFANFSLSAAIALLVLALWIRLRDLPFVWRFCLFAPLAFVTWVAHTAGWGLLGLGVGAYELARATAPGLSLKRMVLAPLQTIPFALAILPTLLWRQRASGGAAIEIGQDFWKNKLVSGFSLFREHFFAWDMAATLIFLAAILFFYWRGGRRLIYPAAVIALAYLGAFLLCPQVVFNSAFADRRLLTYAAIMVALAIGVAPEILRDPARRRAISLAAIACIAFFVARVGIASIIWHRASQLHEARLTLIDQVPRHSRIFGLAVEPCDRTWNRVGRTDHLQQYALVRRDSMINGIYQNPGLNQVEALFARPNAPFNPNMYGIIRDESCPASYIKDTLQSAMRAFPRAQFDYVWLIDTPPRENYDTHGLKLIAWRDKDRLYRVIR